MTARAALLGFVVLFVTAAVAQQPPEIHVAVSALDMGSPVRIDKISYSRTSTSLGDLVLELENTSSLAVRGVRVNFYVYEPEGCTSTGQENFYATSASDARRELPGFTLVDIAPHQKVTRLMEQEAWRLALGGVLSHRALSSYLRVKAEVVNVAFTNGNQWKTPRWYSVSDARIDSDAQTCKTFAWDPRLGPSSGPGPAFRPSGVTNESGGTLTPTGDGLEYSCTAVNGRVNCPAAPPTTSTGQ